MERRPHPTHDRVGLRRTAAGLVAALPSAFGAVAASRTEAGAWMWLGLVGFAAGLVVLLSTPINRCRCPTCGRRLFRAPGATEFACVRCEIVWTTRSFGESILD